jgi:ATPase family AAA domain-containing protein 3A/B
MSHLGTAARELLTDTNKLAMLAAGGSLLALGVYGAREATRVGGRAAEAWLGTPKLVRWLWGSRGVGGSEALSEA